MIWHQFTALFRGVFCTLLFVFTIVTVGCGGEEAVRDSWLSGLRLQSVGPSLFVPGTHIQLQGSHFVDSTLGTSTLRMEGTLDGQSANLRISGLRFVDFDTLDLTLTLEEISDWPSSRGLFKGDAWVEVATPDSQVYKSPKLSLEFDLRESLSPTLALAGSGAIVYVNDRIKVSGTGFYLHPSEGETVVRVDGCFRVRGDANCDPVTPVEVAILTSDNIREEASFPFLPSIAGISEGVFEGRVQIRNIQAGGSGESLSDAIPVDYELLPPDLFSVSPADISLGQYVDFSGGGFVEGDLSGGTELLVRGVFLPTGAQQGVSVDLVLVPEFVDGRTIRYIINEDDELGRALGSRRVTGRFDGDLRVRVSYDGRTETGDASPFAFNLQPIKQVVYLNFLPDYLNSLRHFGLRAIDTQIRQRVAQVVARDYSGINVEVRIVPPKDFALYSIVDILGQDTNGLGLLGYDNTSGKDVDNLRLFDHIGGVNALTQQDGYPGFGGVFIESLFAFSQHPKGKATKIGDGEEEFDAIFDTFRPDIGGGSPLNASDFGAQGISVPATDPGCPASTRGGQASCAIWVLGNMIGTTVSHEVGHSLGLANPDSPASFHNGSDGENRLMDSGGNRPFVERAQLQGQGPGRFCLEAYEYLREILPTLDPEDFEDRTSCF